MGGLTLAEVRAAARTLTGPIEQVPPMVSAVKVGGRRLHALAREGIEVERAARPVTVHRFDVSPGHHAGRVPHRGGVLLGHLRAGAGRRPRRRLWAGVPTCAICAAPGSGRSPPTTPGRSTSSPRPWCSPRPRPCGTWTRWRWATDVAKLVARGLALDRVPLGVTGDGPWGLVDASHRLLAVYEATETDRIRPAVVLEAAG